VTAHRPSWLVRILSPDGAEIGSGVLVSRRHVVTATEAVPGGPLRPATVWFPNASAAGPTGARVPAAVLDGAGWNPDLGLAVLELAWLADVEPATLSGHERRRGVDVVLPGPVAGATVGVGAVVLDREPAWGRLRLGILDEAGLARAAATGAPVLDPRTGFVVGFLVARDPRRPRMAPVVAALRWLPTLMTRPSDRPRGPGTVTAELRLVDALLDQPDIAGPSVRDDLTARLGAAFGRPIERHADVRGDLWSVVDRALERPDGPAMTIQTLWSLAPRESGSAAFQSWRSPPVTILHPGGELARLVPLEETRRLLAGSLPDRAPPDSEISLIVRVVTEDSPRADPRASPLRAFDLPPGGARLTVVVEAPTGLRPLDAVEQTVLVPAAGDSEPARFPFRTTAPGLHGVTVTAWVGGRFVGELALQVAVGVDTGVTGGEVRVDTLGPLRGSAHEATLQVLLNAGQYAFHLMVGDESFGVVPGERLTADPQAALTHARATLRAMSRGGGDYTPGNAVRLIRAMGIGLWDSLVPAPVKEQFWAVRERISSFSVASSKDTVPWELLYPLAPGQDEGFLVEQFPVLRRAPGQRPAGALNTGHPRFVVPPAAPRNAAAEVAAVRAALDAPESDGDLIADLDRLLALIDSGDTGLVHFACHNAFDQQAGGAIAMTGGAFVPDLLNAAAVQASLRRTTPLVFINACSSGVDVHRYTDVTGFAGQFMRAGAGAFVGTLWDVRSETARRFAEEFYGRLRAGTPLGPAVLQTRRALRDPADADPTWLAYTIYGDPGGTAVDRRG
jgi:hypothetical protein